MSSKTVAWGFSCVTPTDITESFMAKMHKQRFEKASCSPTLWKHCCVSTSHFYSLTWCEQQNLWETSTCRRLLNVPQLCKNIQAGTRPLRLDRRHFGPTFKIQLGGRGRQANHSNCSTDVSVSQAKRQQLS